MRFIACICSYDGAEYQGSQRQQSGFGVQEEIERALETVFKHPAPVVMAGRTDAGVHAQGQCFRFSTESRIPAERVPLALNGVLKRSVRVLRAWEVDESFHPQFSARSRVYRYWIECDKIGNVLLRGLTARSQSTLDLEKMRAAAETFVGRKDFAAWQSAGSPKKSTVREVYRLEISERFDIFGSHLIEVEIEANGFLYKMVRNIVGALLKVGQGRLTVEEVLALTAKKDRTLCPPPAQAQGLCLIEVKY